VCRGLAVGCAVKLTDVRKEFGTGVEAVRALDGVCALFPEGSFTAVMGPSGSGKSTLAALANVAAGTGPDQARS
jgi:putative ABC transport system ATP-binding protein